MEVKIKNEKSEDFLKAYAEDICHLYVKDYPWREADETPVILEEYSGVKRRRRNEALFVV